MIIVEYRLPIPVSLDEYNRALRYVVARVAESTTGVTPGEGVEIIVNRPFGPDNDHGMPEGGVYTEKILRFRSRLPPLLRRVMPPSVTEIHESSWFSNGKGSRCKTIYRNPFLGDRFFLSIESNHLAGVNTSDNALNLSKHDAARRQVMYLDIAGNVPRKLPSEDPSTFLSQKTGRGKLVPNWWRPLQSDADSVRSEPLNCGGAENDALGAEGTKNQSLTSLGSVGLGLVDTTETPDLSTASCPDPLEKVFASPTISSSTVSSAPLDDDSGPFEDPTSRQAAKRQEESELGTALADVQLYDRIRGGCAAPLSVDRNGSEIVCTETSASVGTIAGKSSVKNENSSGMCTAGVSDSRGKENEAVSSSDPEPVPLDRKRTMTCYKLVKLEFTGFGMRRFVQRWVTRAVIPNGFIDIHRKLFCWMDDWTDLTLEEIEAIENETAENVRAVFQEHESNRSTFDRNEEAITTEHEFEYL